MHLYNCDALNGLLAIDLIPSILLEVPMKCVIFLQAVCNFIKGTNCLKKTCEIEHVRFNLVDVSDYSNF